MKKEEYKSNVELLQKIYRKNFNLMKFDQRADYCFFINIEKILELERFKEYLKKDIKEMTNRQKSMIESQVKLAEELGWWEE